jgi:nucleoid-associated protein YgaU
MPVRKAKIRQQASVRAKRIEQQKKSSKWLRYFRFDESYSSLLLGIIVVIITTILLIVIVKDRSLIMQKSTSSTNTQRSLDNNIALESITATQEPELTVTIQPTIKLTAVPTITMQPTVTKVPTKEISNQQGGQIKTHIVTSGENLWIIAEKYYKSGYNWVDIAQANKLSNPGTITSGMKLTIPAVAPKVATVSAVASSQTDFGPKITGATYTVQKGDHLWGIAVRAYADGYKWTEIARVNNISKPNIIEPGQVLKLPRTVK